MKEIGIRELKARASGIVRQVAEQRTACVITRRGRAVGLLAPADACVAGGAGSGDEAWGRLLALAERLAAGGRKRRPALKELAAMRR